MGSSPSIPTAVKVVPHIRGIYPEDALVLLNSMRGWFSPDIDESIAENEREIAEGKKMSTRKSPRNKRRSMVEERESTPEGRLAIEAARATIRLVSFLNEAFEQSGITREELAKRLGTDVDRVNAILEGRDELRIATVARTAYALGYKIDLVPVPYLGA